MDLFKMFLIYLILLVMVLVSVAFVTLLEQKILSGIQIRVGPNLVGIWGLFQPFADAVKLFNKEGIFLRSSNFGVYLISPIISLCLSLFMWVSLPLLGGGMNLMYSVLFFMSISGMSVFPILSSGWSSNCKYSILGSLRSVAQMISYEVSLAMIFLSLIWMFSKLSFSKFLFMQEDNMLNMFLIFPLGLIWLASSLAETNRTPYDFSEGESELVSGFNTEYGAGGFTLIFMAEYSSILFMSVLFSIMFLSSDIGFLFIFKSVLISVIFIWVRGSMPRYRYDKLMNLAWKSFLPISLNLFMFFFGVGLINIV